MVVLVAVMYAQALKPCVNVVLAVTTLRWEMQRFILVVLEEEILDLGSEIIWVHLHLCSTQVQKVTEFAWDIQV